MSGFAKLLATCAAASAACVAYGTLVESKAFRLRRVLAPVLNAGSDPITVLHISDIHLAPGQTAKTSWIAELADLRPDVVVNTGDNLAHAGQVGELQRGLSGLLGVRGVFVLGSNDFYGPVAKSPLSYFSSHKRDLGDPDLPTAELRRMLASGGWCDLEETRVSFEVRGTTLEFVGTGDAHIGRDSYAALAGQPKGDAIRIGVTHSPYLRVLDAMTRDGADLILCGHTHGGQVCVPGYGALTTNCDIDAPRVKGLSEHHASGSRSWLHVSAGLGMSPFAPFRFACPPEATLLTLVPVTE